MWLRERAYWIALALLRFAARGTGHHYQTRLVEITPENEARLRRELVALQQGDYERELQKPDHVPGEYVT